MPKLIDQYVKYYNKVRIHGSIGYLCPSEYFENWKENKEKKQVIRL
ncbi:MAG: hypothetical protein N4A57_17785 [Anaeromicrobium sp.]|jgi:transposase InsO family protein|nr:IS3 family transposase [Anaeromicrobium sp.]MCT4596102.1 hypothetical protein [Anaeromicrobium sp.]